MFEVSIYPNTYKSIFGKDKVVWKWQIIFPNLKINNPDSDIYKAYRYYSLLYGSSYNMIRGEEKTELAAKERVEKLVQSICEMAKENKEKEELIKNNTYEVDCSGKRTEKKQAPKIPTRGFRKG